MKDERPKTKDEKMESLSGHSSSAMSEERLVETQESFLIADVGRATTQVVLLDVVEGAYRFIGRGSSSSTAGAPWWCPLEGIRHALAQVTMMTGRPLLHQGQLICPSRPDGAGVDRFAATFSAAGPLRVLLVGLDEAISLASARHVLHTTYTVEVDAFHLADGRGEQQHVMALHRHRPELILVAGGTEDSACSQLLPLVEAVGLGLNLYRGLNVPPVIYAGSSRQRPVVAEIFKDVTTLHLADNIRPSLDREYLDSAAHCLQRCYDEIKMSELPGGHELARWLRHPHQTTAGALAAIIRVLTALHGRSILAVDLGSDSATLIAADGQSLRHFVHAGQTSDVLETWAASLAEWLPVEIDAESCLAFLHNKKLFPQTVPVTENDLQLEQAWARTLLRRLADDAGRAWGWLQPTRPHFDRLIGRGGALINQPRPGLSLLMLLDALQPVGVFSAALDRHGLLPALGLLADHEPLPVVQMVEGGILEEVGTVVALSGLGRLGETAITVQMQAAAGGTFSLEVPFGSVEVLPLPAGQTAELTLQPARGLNVGFGPGKRGQITAQGGTVGMVIDARGRPLVKRPRMKDQRPRTEDENWSLVLGL